MSNPNQLTSHGQVLQTLTPGNQNYIQNDPFLNYTSPNKNLPFPISNTITLSARKVTFQINTLGNTQHVYSSVQYSDIIALSEYFADWGYSYQVSEGDVLQMTVTIPYDTISGTDFNESIFTAEQWELTTKETQKAIELIMFTDPSTGIGYYLPQWAKLAIEVSFKNQAPSIVIPQGLNSGSNAAQYMPMANVILQMKRAGISSVYGFTQTVKRSACVDTNNINQAFESTADVYYRDQCAEYGTPNFIYCTDDMINTYEIPKSIYSQMLPSYQKQLTVSQFDSVNMYSYAGWLVKAPTVQAVTTNKILYIQEFEWDEWIQYGYRINNLSPSTFPLVPSNPSGNALILS